jgi:hypothetical protein
MTFRSLRWRFAVLVTLSALVIGVWWWYAGPTPQPLAYHNFADQRPLLGVPHALNVLSNLPFIVVGVLGIAFLTSPRAGKAFIAHVERWPYWMFFIGLVLTGIGSSYYHANPNNDTLVWDRAALATTLMALFTAVLAERLGTGWVRWALAPLVLLGIGSVLYWHHTEVEGAGDLRLYLAVQFYPLIVLPLVLWFFPPRYTHGGNLVASLLCYVLAKALEVLDRQVYTAAGLVSGHTLKHLVAALGAAFILLMLWQRRPLRDEAQNAPHANLHQSKASL